MTDEQLYESIRAYASFKFPNDALVYLTDYACRRSGELGRHIKAGPYVVTERVPDEIDESIFYIRCRDAMWPSWTQNSKMDLDYKLEDWLTETEYYIQQGIRRGDSKDCNWHPEVGDRIRVFKNAHPSLFTHYAQSDRFFFPCKVIALDYDLSYDPRGLPRLVVEHMFRFTDSRGWQSLKPPDVLERIDPMLCG